MMLCFICNSDISEDDYYYFCSNMGPEIISVIENDIGYEVDESAQICGHCFSNMIQIMFSQSGSDTQSDQEESELQHSHDQYVCIWCQRSLQRRRTHSLPEGPERLLISAQISPRIIADNSLLCYLCWIRITRIMQKGKAQIEVEILPERTANNTNKCVWCLCSLNRTRSHSIPDGPERSEIISRISPREIPSGARVCYACWMRARRNTQRAASLNNGHQVPAHYHVNIACASCGTSLFRRQTHALANGAVRDLVAARIHPRELPEHAYVCTTCWQHNNMPDQQELMQQTVPTLTMELDEFRHTTNSSSRCFVPLCTNTERLRVPNYLRKQILCSQKLFVTENARICNHHKASSNWDFLDQHHFSKSFTKDEMQSMLLLSIKDIENLVSF